MLSPKSLNDNVSLDHFSVKGCEGVNSNGFFTVHSPLYFSNPGVPSLIEATG